MDHFNRGKCAVCGEEEVQFFPIDVNEWSPSLAEGLEEEQLLDLGFDENAIQINNMMMSRISMCRHCGYCSADIFKPTKVGRREVESSTYRSKLYDEGVTLRNMHEVAYMLAAFCGDVNSMAYHLIILKWFLSRAGIHLFEPKRNTRKMMDSLCDLPKGTLLSLLDISRRDDEDESARTIISELRRRDLNYRESAIIDFQEHLMDEHMIGGFKVAEALEYAEKQMSSVNDSHAIEKGVQ